MAIAFLASPTALYMAGTAVCCTLGTYFCLGRRKQVGDRKITQESVQIDQAIIAQRERISTLAKTTIPKIKKDLKAAEDQLKAENQKLKALLGLDPSGNKDKIRDAIGDLLDPTADGLSADASFLTRFTGSTPAKVTPSLLQRKTALSPTLTKLIPKVETALNSKKYVDGYNAFDIRWGNLTARTDMVKQALSSLGSDGLTDENLPQILPHLSADLRKDLIAIGIS